MGIEIERKYRVKNDDWRNHADASQRFRQGYLCGEGPASIRVRIEGESANINIKAAVVGSIRAEYEYPIPLADAESMLADLCIAAPVEKMRHWVRHGAHTWEIDVFEGANSGLVVAEIELDQEDETFTVPDWAGREVTHDKRYYNHALALHPYRDWTTASDP